MIASRLISESIPPLKPSDTLAHALEWMAEFKTTQLPVVDNGQFVGMISEQEIWEANELTAKVGEFGYSGWQNAYVKQGQHIYEIIRTMAGFKLRLIPVLDDDRNYHGIVRLEDIVHQLGDSLAMQEAGAVMVLMVDKMDYLPSQISQIAEGEDAKILSLLLDQDASSGSLIVTLKLNVEDISHLRAAFQRHGYTIVQEHFKGPQLDDVQRNIDAMRRFMDM